MTERLRSNVSVLTTHSHLQSEAISGALKCMHGDIRHRISIARLTRQSEQSGRKAAMGKSLEEGSEAEEKVGRLVNEGHHRPLEVALELRKQGFSREWTQPKRIRMLVRKAMREKRDREDTERQLRKAGKGLADRLGRAAKSRDEMMCEMLPALCGEVPTHGVDEVEDELERVIMGWG